MFPFGRQVNSCLGEFLPSVPKLEFTVIPSGKYVLVYDSRWFLFEASCQMEFDRGFHLPCQTITPLTLGRLLEISVAHALLFYLPLQLLSFEPAQDSLPCCLTSYRLEK
jgi:hypothetical protein